MISQIIRWFTGALSFTSCTLMVRVVVDIFSGEIPWSSTWIVMVCVCAASKSSASFRYIAAVTGLIANLAEFPEAGSIFLNKSQIEVKTLYNYGKHHDSKHCLLFNYLFKKRRIWWFLYLNILYHDQYTVRVAILHKGMYNYKTNFFWIYKGIQPIRYILW